MPIIDMTRGHIDFLVGEKSVRIGGELLMPDEAGRQHYVVYASSIAHWLPPHDAIPLTTDDREQILSRLVDELPSDRIIVEIDKTDVEAPSAQSGPRRVEGNDICPTSGFWSTPAKNGSRRYFFQGEQMPAFKSDYGLTIWQWDVDQSTPEIQ